MGNKNIFTGAIIGALLVVVIVLLFRGPILNTGDGTTNTENTISATGVAESTVQPDEAAVYLSIETLEDTADESKTENSLISERVMSSLRSLGLKEEDIETLNYNIYPDYDWRSGKRTLKGYKTINSIKVKTKKFSLLGRIIDVGVEAGVNRIDNINFELSTEKEAQAKKDALEKASRDAREKAEAIADGLGVRIGNIISVSSQDYYYRPYPYFAGGLAEEASAKVVADSTIINPQELETRATVIVTFKIK